MMISNITEALILVQQSFLDHLNFVDINLQFWLFELSW